MLRAPLDEEQCMELAKVIGDKAQAARKTLNLKQADVAKRVGIVTEVYGRLERGNMLPSVKTLRRLCLVLNIPADDLLGLAETPVQVDGETKPEADSSEMRALVRKLRRLELHQLRLLSQVAGAIQW
jgi:transcriptional regulator with XRE-family HTH domain